MRLNDIKDKNKRQLEERRIAVLAMEYMIAQLNDESLMDGWLMAGVADGDIYYGCTDTKEVEDYYIGKATSVTCWIFSFVLWEGQGLTEGFTVAE